MDSQCRFGWRKKRPPKALTAALVLTRNSNTNTGLALLFRPASGLDFSTLLEDGKHPFAARIFDHAALTDDGVDQLGRRDVEYRVERIETHRSEEHTSELQSLMRISYAVFCLKKKPNSKNTTNTTNRQ